MEGGTSSYLMGFGTTNINSHNNNIGSLVPPTYNTTNNNNLIIFSDHLHTNCGISASAAAMSMLQDTNPSSNSDVKAKIMSHPHYPRLLSAYLNCQKIGAPAEVVERLEESCRAAASAVVVGSSGSLGGGMIINDDNNNIRSRMVIGEDPALDQFMEAYCEMLIKYEQELSKPFKEAMVFLSTIESQFRAISISTPSHNNNNNSSAAGDDQEGMEKNGSSEDEVDVIDNSVIDPQAEDRELKGQLLRKYSGYLGSLKKEFMKKKKKGKLPKESRQQLLDWWTRHYKWPYPSEAQKLALAESTGLDQKQINNWFINQRKRHWKPSEDMQFHVVMDHHHPHYFMENMNILGSPASYNPMDVSLL